MATNIEWLRPWTRLKRGYIPRHAIVSFDRWPECYATAEVWPPNGPATYQKVVSKWHNFLRVNLYLVVLEFDWIHEPPIIKADDTYEN